MWILAALLAYTCTTGEATHAVIVVPTLSPKTNAAPTSKGINPLTIDVIVNAIVAEDDWMISVSSVPKITNKIVLIYGIPFNDTNNCTTPESGPTSGTAFFKNSSPINSKANPIIALPRPFNLKELIR